MELVTAERIKIRAAEMLAKLHGGYTPEDLRTVLHDIGTALMADVKDTEHEADAIARDDYRATLLGTPEFGVSVQIKQLHTIANIKRLQARTGCSMTEARDALHRAYARMYAGLSGASLANLNTANNTVGRADSITIDPRNYPGSLAQYTPPNDDIPF